MKYTKVNILIRSILVILLLSGCATLDKALEPVDNTINSAESGYQTSTYSINESVNDLANSVGHVEAEVYESKFLKFFADDETIIKNREKYFIKWNTASTIDADKIIRKYIKDHSLDTNININNINISQKMNIINQFYFDIFEKKHIQSFKLKYGEFKEDEFLTNRENINRAHKYNMLIKESEYDWDMKLEETKKDVAELMLSSLYSSPILQFTSYDPYEDEIYLSIKSQKNGFNEKFKFEVKKDIARSIKQNIDTVKPSVYFKISQDNTLEFVGISVLFNGKYYLCDVVNEAYIKQDRVQFSYNNINLEKEKITYSEVINNIIPPDWYISYEAQKHIFCGQGDSKNEAKANARSNYASSIHIRVSSSLLNENEENGSINTHKAISNTKQIVDDVSLEGLKIIRSEKKDGIWFFAMRQQ